MIFLTVCLAGMLLMGYIVGVVKLSLKLFANSFGLYMFFNMFMLFVLPAAVMAQLAS